MEVGSLEMSEAGLYASNGEIKTSYLKLSSPTSFDVAKVTIADMDYTNDDVCNQDLTASCGICLENVDTTMPGDVHYDYGSACDFLVDLGTGV